MARPAASLVALQVRTRCPYSAISSLCLRLRRRRAVVGITRRTVTERPISSRNGAARISRDLGSRIRKRRNGPHRYVPASTSPRIASRLGSSRGGRPAPRTAPLALGGTMDGPTEIREASDARQQVLLAMHANVCRKPAHVGMYMMSATHSWFGADSQDNARNGDGRSIIRRAARADAGLPS